MCVSSADSTAEILFSCSGSGDAGASCFTPRPSGRPGPTCRWTRCTCRFCTSSWDSRAAPPASAETSPSESRSPSRGARAERSRAAPPPAATIRAAWMQVAAAGSIEPTYRAPGAGGPEFFSVNVDPRESVLDFRSAEDVYAAVMPRPSDTPVTPEQAVAAVQSEERNQKMWKWLLLVVIALFGMETYLANRPVDDRRTPNGSRSKSAGKGG